MLRENKEGLDYRLVNKNRCFLEGGYASEGSNNKVFQMHVNLNAQQQWTGLA